MTIQIVILIQLMKMGLRYVGYPNIFATFHFFWWYIFIIYHGIYFLYQVPGMDPSKKKSKASYEAWKSSIMTAKGTTKLAAGKK